MASRAFSRVCVLAFWSSDLFDRIVFDLSVLGDAWILGVYPVWCCTFGFHLNEMTHGTPTWFKKRKKTTHSFINVLFRYQTGLQDRKSLLDL